MAKPHYEEMIDRCIYSDGEVQIGWIIKNGVRKPFYRRKYESSVLTSSEEIIDSVGVKEIEMVEGWLFNDSGFIQPYGSFQYDTTRSSRVFTDGTNIKVQQSTGWQNNNIKARVIIYYSKSTD